MDYPASGQAMVWIAASLLVVEIVLCIIAFKSGKIKKEEYFDLLVMGGMLVFFLESALVFAEYRQDIRILGWPHSFLGILFLALLMMISTLKKVNQHQKQESADE
jgi:hypothetical protein